jgi:hypothetical protein
VANVQVPGVALHWSQLPAQAVLQQYPSTQNPDWHALGDAQTEAFAPLGLQVGASHQFPVVHCASVVHEDTQLPLAQT